MISTEHAEGGMSARSRRAATRRHALGFRMGQGCEIPSVRADGFICSGGLAFTGRLQCTFTKKMHHSSRRFTGRYLLPHRFLLTFVRAVIADRLCDQPLSTLTVRCGLHARTFHFTAYSFREFGEQGGAEVAVIYQLIARQHLSGLYIHP